jgi:hypothetical protein
MNALDVLSKLTPPNPRKAAEAIHACLATRYRTANPLEHKYGNLIPEDVEGAVDGIRLRLSQRTNGGHSEGSESTGNGSTMRPRWAWNRRKEEARSSIPVARTNSHNFGATRAKSQNRKSSKHGHRQRPPAQLACLEDYDSKDWPQWAQSATGRR